MSFVARYAEVARRRAEHVAIEVRPAQEALTHGELWRRAGEVAAELERAGLGREDVVGLPFGRSSELVIGMLGAWRAGAAWVVLDPALPAARRAELTRRANVRATLSDDATRVTKTLEAGSPSDLRAATRSPARDLAYVAFTSGSSGHPKGVRVEHETIVPMLDAQLEAFGLGPSSRCLWVLSPSFDASVSDVGTALLSGGTLLIDGPEVLLDPPALLDRLHTRGVTSIDLPPSLLPRLDPARLPSSLQTVVIGGEVADVEAARRWARVVRLVNVYGPTEATVCSSLERCDATWRGGTLGAPLPHVRYRLVDGELWIGGPCLARDYVDDPEATRARFVVDETGRWYRTGDRVRHDDDAWIFEGRMDRQVKLAGKRAEPEEVEAALARLNVRAAVVPRALGARTALVAFVEHADAEALAPMPPPEAAHLSRALAEVLPAWLVPRRWLRIPALPRSAHGKVDLAALSALALPAEVRSEPPRDPLERRLAVLFAEVLFADFLCADVLCAGPDDESVGVSEVDSVGRDDDFFALGGDSLALLTLLARAESVSIALSASRVLRASTPRALARSLRDELEPELRSTASLEGLVPCVKTTTSSRRGRSRQPATPQRVLLTGATGFLGARLRRALLARGHHVVALVRAPNDTAARARLGDELGGVVAGDVARERFGLDVPGWRALAATTDTVVHLAADVSLAASFESLAPANVDGTEHTLQLAAEAGARVVHASTLSVFVASDREDSVFFEADDASASCRLAGGYAQSKWVAERAVRSVGLGGAIVRYGLLTGASDDGASPSGDWLVRFVRALAQLRAFPAGLDTSELAFDATPIDHAVDATCRIVEHASGAAMETFHVASARAVHVGRLIAAIRDEGVSLAPVAPTTLAQLPEASIVLGVARALDPHRFARQRALDLFAATGVRFDDAHARALGIVAPSVDDAYLRRCVRWMLSSVREAA